LIEVYPALLALLAGHQHLPKKTSLQGRADRYEILLKLGVRFLPDFSLQTLPTHDHLDAALQHTSDIFLRMKELIIKAWLL